MKYTWNCGLFAIVFCVLNVNAKVGYGPGEQDWGHVDVRQGAHIFYWLYYTTAELKNYTERPLAIWLQGGPGASSTGYGNFEELGPLDLYGNYRNFTWVKDMNVLFIDNPVGAGFSYVDQIDQLTTTNYQIARDLVNFMKGFYKLHPEFENVPLHIFSESYGGKMAPEFALELYYAIKRGELRSNLTSVMLGDPWTSPIDSVLAWAPLLLNMGIVDDDGYEKIMVEANKTEALINSGKWKEATTQWGNTQTVLLRVSKGVDFYNILKPTAGRTFSKLSFIKGVNVAEEYRNLVQAELGENREQLLLDLMRGPVSEALNIPSIVHWGEHRGTTFSWLSEDFMKPYVHIVTELLEKTDLEVGVLSGHLDLICATAGTVNWINKMQWSYKSKYEAAKRIGINVDGILEGYEKSAGKFTMYWINRAGHMAPADNPAGMSYILRKVTNYG